jgi:uncharacterized membrane protein
MARQKVSNVDERRHWKEELVPMPRPQAGFHVSPGYRPDINHLTMGQPWHWLKRGWADLRRTPGLGIGYGLLVTLIYGAVVALALSADFYHLVVQLTAGFVLLAPLSALGFYEVSRRREAGESVAFGDMFRALRRNPKGALGMGVVMVLLFLTWFMVSMQTAAVLAEGKAELVLFTGGAETWGEFTSVLVTNLSVPMLLAYFGIGFVAVLVAFAFTAVSIPLLMDHPETDAITALVASWQAVTRNWRPMLLWAAIIAVVTGLGLALFYVGLAVTLPLLGFATWHAYRETLGEWREVEVPHAEYY